MTRRKAVPSKVPTTAPRTLRTHQLVTVQGGAVTSYVAGKYGIDSCDYDGNVQS